MPSTKFRSKKKFKQIVRPPLATGLIFIGGWLGNELIEGWSWDETDFIVIGVMILITGYMIELVINKVHNKHSLQIAIGMIMFVFLWLWAELAVGIFTDWGS